MAGGRPKSFTSVTITAQRTLPPCCDPLDLVNKSAPPKPQETLGGNGSPFPTGTTRVPNTQPDACRPGPATVKPREFGRAYLPADGFAVGDLGARAERLVQSSLGYTETTRCGSSGNVSSLPRYRSCVRLEVPLRSITSVLFLDKSLSMCLVELEGRRAGQTTTLHGSTMSIRFDARMSAGCWGPRGATSGRGERNARGAGSGRRRGPPWKHGAHEVERTAPKQDAESRPGDSDASLGLLSSRGPMRSNAGGQEGNADEAAKPKSSHRQRTFDCGPVNFRTWSKSAGSEKTEERQERKCSSEPRKRLSRLNADSLEGTSKNLSLKEALELLRPDFISRSQGRVRRLERRAGRRRCLQDPNPDLAEQGPREDQGKQDRNCTTPDPLSDNLFKPRERTISGKEMQRRSRRIYNQLPEVTKKKEEEKKKAVSQTNRLRADVYKKRLLDQILQR
ncbi:uncharacterized protein ACO6RY_17123 [Pungitius sinensis]